MYPTEDQLDMIKRWNCTTYEDSVALAEYICRIWYFDEWATLTGKRVKTLRLATAGWSGNEDIVGALHRNFSFMRHWMRSERGGLTIYKIKPYTK